MHWVNGNAICLPRWQSGQRVPGAQVFAGPAIIGMLDTSANRHKAFRRGIYKELKYILIM
jgi:hypothetical protein